MSHIRFMYHFVWRTKCSVPAIDVRYEKAFHDYVTGIVINKDCHIYAINSMPDHVHLLVEVRPDISISEFMKVIKGESSKWMKQHEEWYPLFTGWGNGYGGFSYSVKERDTVIRYIRNQKKHHNWQSFPEEFRDTLVENGLNPDDDLFFVDD